MSAQAHARRKLLEVRICGAHLRAHAGATKHPPGQGNQASRTDQKFFGRPRWRRAMMFFWTSDEPPPSVSIEVAR